MTFLMGVAVSGDESALEEREKGADPMNVRGMRRMLMDK